MYSITQFGEMVADRIRVDAYLKALRSTVGPDSVVLDIGTGTGVLALLACQCGARRVIAIEPSDAIQVAREVAAANGFGERIEFIQAVSTRVQLPEPANVIVSDLRGVLPLHGGHLVAIADARERLLAPGGVLIPRSDSLWIAAVDGERHYRRVATPWMERVHGLDLEVVSRMVSNTWWRADVTPPELLSAAERCASIEYTRVASSDLDATAVLVAARPGVSHGFCLWFDADLCDVAQYSNAPGCPSMVYGRAFFPWSRPVPMREGDVIRVELKARLTGDDYLWSWSSNFESPKGEVKARYRQSTFLGMPLAPNRLKMQSPAHVPHLSEDGKLDRRVLELMAQGRSLASIADAIAEEFPLAFAHRQDALVHLAAMAQKYGRPSP